MFTIMVMGNSSDWSFIIKFIAQNSSGAYELFYHVQAHVWARISVILTVMTLGIYQNLES